MKILKEILTNPSESIMKAKKEKSQNKTLILLLLTWVLVGIGFLFLNGFESILTSVSLSFGVFTFGILFSIFLSYVINIVINILGGKGKFFDSLIATTYSSLPISIGFVASTLFYAIQPIIGLMIGFFLITITTAQSLSIYFRAIKEFYSTDMFTAFIGLIIILYTFMVAFYISAAFSASSTIVESLPSLL